MNNRFLASVVVITYNQRFVFSKGLIWSISSEEIHIKMGVNF